jgi:hypothetical protein
MGDPAAAVGGVELLDPAAAAFGRVAVSPGVEALACLGVRLAADTASYPEELRRALPDEHLLVREVIRFEADPLRWAGAVSVTVQGYFSHVDDELLCFPSIDPAIPANRWLHGVGFALGSSGPLPAGGLLSVHIQASAEPAGSADYPYLQFWVSGRFAPGGTHSERYAFRLLLDSYAQVHADQVQPAPDISVDVDGDHVRVRLAG